ncbi:MAG: stage III sporulation protein AC [Clostridiales bacterium]|nr:stage III sporulation protein AC [Clostridiales bacterium]
MNVDLVFQIAGIGIVVAVLNQLLNRAGRDEMALMVTIAGLIAVLFIVSEQIGELFSAIKRIFGL